MKAGKTHMSIHPRPFRIAGYLFWLGAMVVMYLMFRSFLLLFFAVFLCLIPIMSVLSGVLLARHIRCEIGVPSNEYARQGDEVFPTVKVLNYSWIGTLDVRMELRIYNTFFREKEEAETLAISLPAIARTFRKKYGEAVLRMPFTTTRIGNIRIIVEKIEVQDWFGLIRFKIDPVRANYNNPSEGVMSGVSLSEMETNFVTLPNAEKTRLPEPESISSGMTEVEESNRKGNDFSEVTDLREYMPGDRIRDIHWKASARREEWMVKVRTQMAGMELNAVLLLDRDEQVTENIVENTYRELRSWADGENDIHLRVYSAVTYGFDSFVLSAPADVDAAFDELFQTHYGTRLPEEATPEGMDSILKNRYPYMGGYIRFGQQSGGGIGWEPVEGVR